MPLNVPKPSEIQAHAGRTVHVYGALFLSHGGFDPEARDVPYYSPRPAVIVEQVGPHSYIVNIQILKRDEEASVVLTGEKGAVVGQATVELYDKLLFVDRMDLFESLQPAAAHDKKPVLWAEWPPIAGVSLAPIAAASAAAAAASFPPDPAAPEAAPTRVLDDHDDTDKARLEPAQPGHSANGVPIAEPTEADRAQIDDVH